jgi:hypothetical protein
MGDNKPLSLDYFGKVESSASIAYTLWKRSPLRQSSRAMILSSIIVISRYTSEDAEITRPLANLD